MGNGNCPWVQYQVNILHITSLGPLLMMTEYKNHLYEQKSKSIGREISEGKFNSIFKEDTFGSYPYLGLLAPVMILAVNV